MSRFFEAVEAEMPGDAYRWGNVVFVNAEVALSVIDRAEAKGIPILGIEGYLIDVSTGEIYAAMDRIANLGAGLVTDAEESVKRTCAQARSVLKEWAHAPNPAVSLMDSRAHGQYMLAIYVAE
jgi:hypothetical protein